MPIIQLSNRVQKTTFITVRPSTFNKTHANIICISVFLFSIAVTLFVLHNLVSHAKDFKINTFLIVSKETLFCPKLMRQLTISDNC